MIFCGGKFIIYYHRVKSDELYQRSREAPASQKLPYIRFNIQENQILETLEGKNLELDKTWSENFYTNRRP